MGHLKNGCPIPLEEGTIHEKKNKKKIGKDNIDLYDNNSICTFFYNGYLFFK